MATKQRIYLVEGPGDATRLVRATSVSQARNHVLRGSVSVSVAKQDRLVELLSGSERLEVEDAAAEVDEDEQQEAARPAKREAVTVG